MMKKSSKDSTKGKHVKLTHSLRVGHNIVVGGSLHFIGSSSMAADAKFSVYENNHIDTYGPRQLNAVGSFTGQLRDIASPSEMKAMTLNQEIVTALANGDKQRVQDLRVGTATKMKDTMVSKRFLVTI